MMLNSSDERRAEIEAKFKPVTSGWCEAGGWAHRVRARYEGPLTESGGNLWCGTCKRAEIEKRLSRLIAARVRAEAANPKGEITQAMFDAVVANRNELLQRVRVAAELVERLAPAEGMTHEECGNSDCVWCSGVGMHRYQCPWVAAREWLAAGSVPVATPPTCEHGLEVPHPWWPVQNGKAERCPGPVATPDS